MKHIKGADHAPWCGDASGTYWRVGESPSEACDRCLKAIAAEMNRYPGSVIVASTEPPPN